jgi:hypothetical protein
MLAAAANLLLLLLLLAPAAQGAPCVLLLYAKNSCKYAREPIMGFGLREHMSCQGTAAACQCVSTKECVC